MLGVYAEQFKSDGSNSVVGRKGRLFMEICKPKKTTRKQLSLDFDLRPGTVSSIVLELIEQGLVSEGRPEAPYRKGRPEILLRPATSRLAAIVFYVVSQSIHAVLVGFGGEEIGTAVSEVQAENVENDSLKHLIVDMAKNLINQASPETEIVGISFSLPGIVEENAMRWVFASRWTKIRNLDLSQIADELKLPVIVSKNLNCELRARITRKSEFKDSSILFVRWGFGIGASLFLNGSAVVAGNGGFGEIGHSYIGCDEDNLCRCGMKNCLETKAALWALLPRLRAVYPDIPEDEWSFEAFLKEREDFDINLLDEAIQLMAVAMQNLTLILSPHQIVLSGPFVQHPAVFQKLNDRFRELLPSNSRVLAQREITVAVSRAGTEDEITGAAYPLFERALKSLCR